MTDHMVKTPMMSAGRQRNQAGRARNKAAYAPTVAEERALASRIDSEVAKYKALCGDPESWSDAGKAAKLVEQLYRNELLRIQALKDQGALVPLDEVAKRDELTAAAFQWAMSELMEYMAGKIPAHLRNDARAEAGQKMSDIMADMSQKVANGMSEFVPEEPELLQEAPDEAE